MYQANEDKVFSCSLFNCFLLEVATPKHLHNVKSPTYKMPTSFDNVKIPTNLAKTRMTRRSLWLNALGAHLSDRKIIGAHIWRQEELDVL